MQHLLYSSGYRMQQAGLQCMRTSRIQFCSCKAGRAVDLWFKIAYPRNDANHALQYPFRQVKGCWHGIPFPKSQPRQPQVQPAGVEVAAFALVDVTGVVGPILLTDGGSCGPSLSALFVEVVLSILPPVKLEPLAV